MIVVGEWRISYTLSILNLNSISLRGEVGGPNIGVKTTKTAVTFHNNESGQLAQIKLLFSFLVWTSFGSPNLSPRLVTDDDDDGI